MKQIIVDNQATAYFITSDGRCYNGNTKLFLKGQYSNSGYLNYNLTLNDGTKRRLYAHRLVATAFIPNNELTRTEVNHKDGNKRNNHVDNLEWVTPKENMVHASNNGLIKHKIIYCFNKNKQLYKTFDTVAQAASFIHGHPSTVSQALYQPIKTLVYGYYWSYDEILDKTTQYENHGIAKEICQYTIDGQLLRTFSSISEAGRFLGIKRCNHVSECCRRKIKSYKGYIWRYKDDIV